MSDVSRQLHYISECPTEHYGFLGKWKNKHHLTSMEAILSSNRVHIKTISYQQIMISDQQITISDQQITISDQ
jgi:hypothetical protein